MRVLMVSPHPTYSPRGTPISVLNRCRALSALGHEVDLVTYGIGEDVPVPGLRYLRAPVPGLHAVRVGPSPAKLPLDLAVFVKAVLRRRHGRYDVLHTHEEAGCLGLLPGRALPHVYDMGNDLEVVLRNYGFGQRHPLTRAAALAERTVMASADVVIAHFPTIAAKVRETTGGRTAAVVVANTALEPAPDDVRAAVIRQQASPDGLPLLVYTGTFEDYQGLPLAVGAVAALSRQGRRVRLLAVGGTAAQRAGLQSLAESSGVADLVTLPGVVPQDSVPDHLRAADVLLSPRASGTNTPLKLFSYLRSGRPLVATRIESHTQVLDDTTATLVPVDGDGLAAGVAALLDDPEAAAAQAAAGVQLLAGRYDTRAYVRGVASAYEAVGAGAVPEHRLDEAVAAIEGRRLATRDLAVAS